MKRFFLLVVCLFGLTLAAPAAPDFATYKFENVVEVLTAYGKLTGKKILIDPSVQGQVGIAALPEENADQKIELIEKTLFLSGYSLIDVGDGMVAAVGLGKSVRNLGLPLYTKPEELPHGERVFSYLFKLEHRDPVEVLALLSQYLPPAIITSFAADRAGRTIIATAPTSAMRNLIKLVSAMDVPVSLPEQKPAPVAPKAAP